MKTPATLARKTAFSLIELLVVVGIIGIVVTFAVPAASRMIKGSHITQSSQMLSDQFSYARQLAQSRNAPVEVRIYKYADPEIPGESVKDKTTWKYRAFQLFHVLENGRTIEASPVRRLPAGIVISIGQWKGADLSTLLTHESRGGPKAEGIEADKDHDPELPGRTQTQRIGFEYEYQAFRFMQDGSTNLPVKMSESGSNGTSETLASWFLTILDENANLTGETLPNFYTIQVDASSGTTKSYRPQAG